MALSNIVPDSFTEAKEVLKTSLINLCPSERTNYPFLKKIIQKHPDLIFFEYKKENLETFSDQLKFDNKQEIGFYGTPLLLACEQHGYDKGKYLDYC